jgi:subtilisin-like proprotein convertase family protein
MKKQIVLGAMAAVLAMASARGGISESFTSGGSVGTVPDGSPVGALFTGTVSDLAGQTVSGLTVDLNFSGGYNGNLYGYLVAPNGTLVVLMNQPGVSVNGFGASGAGMNITLSDAGSTSIQSETSSSVLSGTYSAAGSLSYLNGSSANGTWELFFSDQVNGGGTSPSTLVGWSLNIEAVPEPVNVALGIFGGLMGLLALARSQMVRAKLKF